MVGNVLYYCSLSFTVLSLTFTRPDCTLLCSCSQLLVLRMLVSMGLFAICLYCTSPGPVRSCCWRGCCSESHTMHSVAGEAHSSQAAFLPPQQATPGEQRGTSEWEQRALLKTQFWSLTTHLTILTWQTAICSKEPRTSWKYWWQQI